MLNFYRVIKIFEPLEKSHFDFSYILETVPSRNRILAIIPVQTDIWELSFDFVLKEDLPTSWMSLVRLSTTEDNTQVIGYRIPSVYIRGRRMDIGYSTHSNPYKFVSKNLELNRKYRLKIRQCVDLSDPNALHKLVSLDGVLIRKQKHSFFATKFTNIKIYLGDNSFPSAPVQISNFVYTPNLLYPGMYPSHNYQL